jgi:hypothetical protein
MMRTPAASLLAIAVIAGTVADRPRANQPLHIGGFRVIAADFHTHSSTWSDGAITPWGLVLEAQRHGLDAIAITGHNQVMDSRWGRWFSRRIAGPIVFTGEEILTTKTHIVAVGIERTVSWRQSAAAQIDDIHAQGGVAIAVHPVAIYWPGFDSAAMTRLDGAEICHPLAVAFPEAQADLEHFAARASLAAIGSSDFHGLGPMGACRTFVFTRDGSARAILDAIRARQTVVYGLNGAVYGDPTLVALAESDGRLRVAARNAAAPTLEHPWLTWTSRVAGVAGLFLLIITAGLKPTPYTTTSTP